MDVTPNPSFPMRGDAGRVDWFDTTRYTVVQRFFLGRLERLVAVRNAPDSHLEPWQRVLVHRAIYSTYCDCVELGLTEEARILLHREQRTPHGSASA